jgi:phage/plasmid primase-like uncharacterized protein
MKLDATAIRALLTPAMVLDYYEIARRGRAQWSVQLCPTCGQLHRGSVSIHPDTGLWKCHHCQAHGGLYDLIAGYAGVDIKKEFHRVVGLAATIAGVPHGVPDEEYAKLLEEHRTRRAESAAREEARRARARAHMPLVWMHLDRRSVKGERYLSERRLDPEPLRACDAVRYSRTHDPAVALRDLATGEVVGIQYRKLEGDAKLISQPWSQAVGSCLLGCLADLESARVAILIEGLADTLAARLIWPDAAIFGAPGASHLGAIATAIAPRVAEKKGILLVVPDNDDVGVHNAALAVIAAQEAGLELVESAREDDASKVQIVDLGRDLLDQRHHDLADARKRTFWRWSWPA